VSTQQTKVDVQRLRGEVEDKYAEVAEAPDAEHHFHTGRRALDHLGYPADQVEELPDEAVDAFSGVADLFHWGLPAEGERVVDVGAGAGTDCLLAARAVGPDGAVVGVDMNEQMLDRARRAANTAGMRHVEFRRGLAEELPVEDGWADRVISNGVLNLVPDKPAAYREIFRVLRPGGQLQVSDICVEQEVPEGAKADVDLWTA
jgi:SAM-dependent methyltransferase